MDERQRKFVAAMREVQRSMDAHFGEFFAKLARERSPDVVPTHTYMDGDKVVIREISSDEFYVPSPINVTPGTGPTEKQKAEE